MKNFTYRSQVNDMETVLSRRKKQLFRQQLLFTLLFTVLLLLLAIWLYRRVRFAEFDGHVRLNFNEIRMVDDIYIVEYNFRPGDLVNEGDTLFKYVFVNQILQYTNVNNLTSHEADYRDYDIKARLTGQEIAVLREKVADLDRQIAEQERLIAFGASTMERKQELERERSGYQAEIASLRRRLAVYNSYTAQANKRVENVSIHTGLPSLYTLNYIREHFADYRGVRSYYLAQTDAIVTDIRLTVGSVAFKKETVMTTQSRDEEQIDLHVMAYVSADDMRYIREGGSVQVIVNDDLVYDGIVSKAGLKVIELPKHLQNSFSSHIEAVGVRIDLLDVKHIPFWVKSDNLPVRVRVDKLRRSTAERPVSSVH